jgi:long-subunit acyl-CoA synthetase (AMP-forming)
MNREEMPPVSSSSLSFRLFLIAFFAEGELVVKSHIISKGYLRFDNSSFTIGSDGAITFRTGDIYGRSAEQRLIWKGRKEDYIQVSSFLVES